MIDQRIPFAGQGIGPVQIQRKRLHQRQPGSARAEDRRLYQRRRVSFLGTLSL